MPHSFDAADTVDDGDRSAGPVAGWLHARPSWSSVRPESTALARLVGWQYIVGAIVIGVGLLLPTGDPSDRLALGTIAAVALVIGIALRLAPRVAEASIDMSISVVVLLITACVMVSRPMGLTPLFYFWPLMLSAYYATPTRLVVNTALAISTFGFALATIAETGDRTLAFVEFSAVATVVVFAVARLRSKSADLFGQLERAAESDVLTGVLNRRGFEQRVEQRIGAGGAFGTAALIAFDIDHFKRINDQRGHIGGDRALRQFAGIVRDCLGADAVFGRVGGEEFAVVLPATSVERAGLVSEQIRLAVVERTRRGEFAMTVSAGVAAAATFLAAWEAADRALYEAKDAGRNRTVTAAAEPGVGHPVVVPTAA